MKFQNYFRRTQSTRKAFAFAWALCGLGCSFDAGHPSSAVDASVAETFDHDDVTSRFKDSLFDVRADLVFGNDGGSVESFDRASHQTDSGFDSFVSATDLVSSDTQGTDQGPLIEDIRVTDAGVLGIDRVNSDTVVDHVEFPRTDASFDGERRPDAAPGGDVEAPIGEVFVNSVRQLEISCDISCALTPVGELYCWGIGSTIRNGGTGDERIHPRRMEGFRDIVQFSMDCEAGCAVDHTGSVFCIGSNYMGGLQVASDAGVVRVAERRTDVSNVAQVSWNGSTILMRNNDGSVYSRNYVPSVLTRVPVPGTPVSITGGVFGRCAVLTSGRLACYGAFISSVEPWPVSEWMRVAIGRLRRNCAITASPARRSM